jgi:hypothetical protein
MRYPMILGSGKGAKTTDVGSSMNLLHRGYVLSPSNWRVFPSTPRRREVFGRTSLNQTNVFQPQVGLNRHLNDQPVTESHHVTNRNCLILILCHHVSVPVMANSAPFVQSRDHEWQPRERKHGSLEKAPGRHAHTSFQRLLGPPIIKPIPRSPKAWLKDTVPNKEPLTISSQFC